VETPTDLVRFLATSAEDVADVCDIIRANDLELVCVELLAAPRIEGAAGEMVLVFGEPPSRSAVSAEQDAAA
jgi:hypothetical protein